MSHPTPSPAPRPHRPAPLATPPAALSVRDRVMMQLVEGKWDGPRAYKMWLPPLVAPMALDRLLGEDRALNHPAHMRIPMGIIDNPRRHSQTVWSITLDGTTSNAAIGGATLLGKSTFVQTMILSGACTHSPRDLQFYCLDYSSNQLVQLEDLPHVGGVATELEEAKVRRTIAELITLLDRRRAYFTQHRIAGMAHYRQLRNDPNHPVSQDPFGDAVLVIDGWSTFYSNPDNEKLVEQIITLATTGPGFGIHVVITTTRWSDLRSRVRDLLGLKVEFHPASPDDTVLNDNRKALKSVPKRAGRCMSAEYLHIMIAAPRLDGANTMAEIADTYAQTREVITQQWQGHQSAPPVRTLPDRVPVADLLRMKPLATPQDSYKDRWTIPVGLLEQTMQPAIADLANYPHLLVFGDSRAGKTSALRAVVRGILQRNSEKQVAFIVVDYRGKLLGLVPESYMVPNMYLRNPNDVERSKVRSGPTNPNDPMAVDPSNLLAGLLNTRRPPASLTAEQLKERSWWEGYDVVLVIDDFHQMTQAHSHTTGAMSELLPYISSATDVGFHLIAGCHMKFANSLMSRGLISSAYGMGSSTILLSGDKQDFPSGREFSVTKRPKGQGLYRTADGLELIQAGFDPPTE